MNEMAAPHVKICLCWNIQHDRIFHNNSFQIEVGKFVVPLLLGWRWIPRSNFDVALRPDTDDILSVQGPYFKLIVDWRF